MKLNINKKSVSEQIAAYFREEIEKGKYKPGDAFPSERQLEAETGISRKTVNKAISILAGQGYVFKEQGRSTFVADWRKAAAPVIGENNLAFVFDTPESMYHPYIAPLFRLLCGLTVSGGYGTKIVFDADPALPRLRRDIAGGGVCGAFVFPLFPLRALIELGVPFSIFAPIFGEPPVGRYATSYADELDAMRQATRYLVGKKRSRLMFLSGNAERESEAAREKAFLKEAGVLGLKLARVMPTRYDREETARAVAASSRLGADGIVAADDMVARWAVDALCARGVRVPDDVAVIGFNDMEMYSTRPPPLTTFRLPYEEIAASAFLSLIRLIAGGKGETSVAKYVFKQGDTA